MPPKGQKMTPEQKANHAAGMLKLREAHAARRAKKAKPVAPETPESIARREKYASAVAKRKATQEAKKAALAEAAANPPRPHTLDNKQMTAEEFGVEILKRMEAIPLLWGMYYFPVYFRQQGPGFHLRIVQEAMSNMFLAVHAPRGSAKSTILTFLMPGHGIAFKKYHFIVIIQSTYAKAAASLNNIKAEIKDNAKFALDFGITCRKDAEGDTIFRHRDGFEVRVLCKGSDQIGSLRGEKFGAYRPDLIIVDDLEEDEAVRNPERRQELEKQFNEVLNYIGEVGVTRMLIVGTILHDDSLLRKLLSRDKYPQFKKLFFKARGIVNGEMQSLWPERWSVTQLDEMERRDPAGFAKEMMGDPSSGSMEAFSRKDFRYWRADSGVAILFHDTGEVKAKWNLADCKAAIACDLAWESKRDSDESVILPAYITPDADILVEDYIAKRGMRPEELEESLFVMEARLEKATGKRVAIGFEKAKLEKVMKHLLGQAMRRRNKFLWMVDLQWDGDKLQRIMTRLANRYAQHVIHHKRGSMGALENQLVRLRSAAHDDLCLVGDTKIATLFGEKRICDVMVGDLVLTPDGIRRVIASKYTGMHDVVESCGMEGTLKHPVFNLLKGFVHLEESCYSQTSQLKYREVLIWRYKSLLNSMASNTGLWVGKENIISVSQLQMLDGRILKDFMLRFGNFITRSQFRKATTFIIKMGIVLTMHQIIWSVFQSANTAKFLRSLIVRKMKNICLLFEKQRQYGISPKKAERGTVSMERNLGRCANLKSTSVNFVEENSPLAVPSRQIFAQTTTQNNGSFKTDTIQRRENVWCADLSSPLNKDGLRRRHVQVDAQRYTGIKPVYNITVEKSNMYYANGVLVGNCDALQGVVQLLSHAPGRRKVAPEEDTFEKIKKVFLGEKSKSRKPYVFGGKYHESPIKAISSW